MSAHPDTDGSDGDAAMRGLAALLPCGVLLLDASRSPRFANDRACALLDVADDAQLRARWDGLARTLGLADTALPHGAEPLRVGGTLDAGDGSRAIRAEVHATGAQGGSEWLVLMQRRDRPDDADEILFAASRAGACQHVLGGLLHDLNGPLNNLNLTLALLEGTLARITAQQPDDPALERCRRYVGTLGTETRRFSECARAMGVALAPADDSIGVIPVPALLGETQHALRHHASLREVRVSVDAADAGLSISGNVDMLRLALVDLMLTAIDATAPGGEITLSPQATNDTLRVRVSARAARMPADALRGSDGIVTTPRAQWLGYVAARRILEMHGGSATLDAVADDVLAIDMTMPLSRA